MNRGKAADQMRNIFGGLITQGVWVPREFVVICAGDANAAMLLRQIIHWSIVMDGEFYKRHGSDHGDGWQDETGLSEDQTKRSTKKLKALAFIETRVGHGYDNKVATFYGVRWEKITDALSLP